MILFLPGVLYCIIFRLHIPPRQIASREEKAAARDRQSTASAFCSLNEKAALTDGLILAEKVGFEFWFEIKLRTNMFII